MNSAAHRYCSDCAKKRNTRRAYLYHIKTGRIKNPGIGRQKPSGEDNPNFVYGSVPWQRETLKLDYCERCESSEQLELHHKDRDTTHWRDGNVETLCFDCHRAEHKDNKAWKHKGKACVNSSNN